MKTVEDVPYLVHVFRFFYLIYIIYDGFEHAKLKYFTLFYRERQPLVFIYFDRLYIYYKIDQGTSEPSAFKR